MARSQAQRDAQLRAMEAARGAAALRAHAKREAERFQAEQARALAEHVHEWKNWEYSADYKTETHTCRICGAIETRRIRL